MSLFAMLTLQCHEDQQVNLVRHTSPKNHSAGQVEDRGPEASEDTLRASMTQENDAQLDSLGIDWCQTGLDPYLRRFLDPAIPTSMEWVTQDELNLQ